MLFPSVMKLEKIGKKLHSRETATREASSCPIPFHCKRLLAASFLWSLWNRTSFYPSAQVLLTTSYLSVAQVKVCFQASCQKLQLCSWLCTALFPCDPHQNSICRTLPPTFSHLCKSATMSCDHTLKWQQYPSSISGLTAAFLDYKTFLSLIQHLENLDLFSDLPCHSTCSCQN